MCSGDKSEKDEYNSEDELESSLDLVEKVKELFEETFEPSPLNKEPCALEPGSQPRSPRKEIPNDFPTLTEANSPSPPSKLLGTRADNSGTHSPIPKTCVFSTFVSPNYLIEKGI